MVKWTNRTWRLEGNEWNFEDKKLNGINWIDGAPEISRKRMQFQWENQMSSHKKNKLKTKSGTDLVLSGKKRPKLRRNKNKTAAGWENPQLSFRPKQKLKERSAFYIFFLLFLELWGCAPFLGNKRPPRSWNAHFCLWMNSFHLTWESIKLASYEWIAWRVHQSWRHWWCSASNFI